MATIVPTSTKPSGVLAVTETTLNGTLDTFAFRSGAGQVLVFRNPTAAAVTPTILGSLSTSVGVEGIGTITVSGGFPVGSIAIGAVRSIRVDSIFQYLQGTISITGGTGLVATLLEA